VWSFFQHSSICQFCFWQFFAWFAFGNFWPGSFLAIFCWVGFWQFFAWFVFGDFLPGSFLAIFYQDRFWQFFAWFVFGNFLPGLFLAIFCQVCFRQFFAGFVFGNFSPGSFLAIFCRKSNPKTDTFEFASEICFFFRSSRGSYLGCFVVIFSTFVHFPVLFLAIFCRVCFWQFFAETRIGKRTRSNLLLEI